MPGSVLAAGPTVPAVHVITLSESLKPMRLQACTLDVCTFCARSLQGCCGSPRMLEQAPLRRTPSVVGSHFEAPVTRDPAGKTLGCCSREAATPMATVRGRRKKLTVAEMIAGSCSCERTGGGGPCEMTVRSLMSSPAHIGQTGEAAGPAKQDHVAAPPGKHP